MEKGNNNTHYKTNQSAAVFLLLVWSLLPLLALLPPVDWESFGKSMLIALPSGTLLYIFLFRLTYVQIESGFIISSLLSKKKRLRINDITEIQRGNMYRGFALFGYQAFVMYKEPDGSIGYFEMSENLYSRETLVAFFKALRERNKEIKIDPYYEKLLSA